MRQPIAFLLMPTAYNTRYATRPQDYWTIILLIIRKLRLLPSSSTAMSIRAMASSTTRDGQPPGAQGHSTSSSVKAV